MRYILAATDFSERSHRAVRRAAMLAGESGASLLLLHVADDDRDKRIVDAEVAAARTELHEMKARLPKAITSEAHVELGDPFDAILRVAVDSKADLIVMGAHRRQLLRDTFVGTSVERVTRARVAPVLMVNAEPEGPYRRALVGVDLSAHSARALDFARNSGALRHADLAVAHAFDAVAKGKMTFAGVDRAKVNEYTAQMDSQARSDLAAFMAANPGQPEPSVLQVGEGHPALVLAAVAQSLDADLVIVGTQGLSGIARLLLGSVTETLMRDSVRDVLAVPPNTARSLPKS